MKKERKQTQMLQRTGAEMMRKKRRRMMEELEVEVTVGPRERLA